MAEAETGAVVRCSLIPSFKGEKGGGPLKDERSTVMEGQCP